MFIKLNEDKIVSNIKNKYNDLNKADFNYEVKLEQLIDEITNIKSDSIKLKIGKQVSKSLLTKKVINSMNRNSNKIKALKINPNKELAYKLRTTNSVSPYLIKKNISFFIKIESDFKISEEELKRKSDLLLKMEDTNGGVCKSIDFRLLDKKYIDFLGEDKISYISLFKRQSNQLLRLTDKELLILKKLYDNYFNTNDTKDWCAYIQQMFNRIEYINKVQREYNNYLLSIGKKPISNSFFENIDINKVNINNLSNILLTNYPTFIEDRIIKRIQNGKISNIDKLLDIFLKENGNPLDTVYPDVIDIGPLTPHLIKQDDGKWMPCVIMENGKIQKLGTPSSFEEASKESIKVVSEISTEKQILGLFKEDGTFQKGAYVYANKNGWYQPLVYLNNDSPLVIGDPIKDEKEARKIAISKASQIENYGWSKENEELNNISINDLKELILFKAFGIPLYEDKDDNYTIDQRKGVKWLIKTYGQDVDTLEESPYKNLLKTMMLIYEIDDIKELKKIFNSIETTNKIDIIQLESKLKQEYLKLYNKHLTDPKTLKKNEDGLYETNDIFLTLMTTVGAYSGAGNLDDAKNDWNRKSLRSQHFCASLISNKQIGCCFSEGKVCYGFTNLDEDSLLLSGTSDIYSTGGTDFGVWNRNVNYNRKIEFLSPHTMINKTTGRYNEIDIRRNQHGMQNDPSYIVVFKIDNKYRNLNESKRASKSFDDLPLVTIDVNKYMRSNVEQLFSLENTLSESIEQNNIKKILDTYEQLRENIQLLENTIITFWADEPGKCEFYKYYLNFYSRYTSKKIVKRMNKYEEIYHKNEEKQKDVIQKIKAEKARKLLTQSNIIKPDGTYYSIDESIRDNTIEEEIPIKKSA